MNWNTEEFEFGVLINFIYFNLTNYLVYLFKTLFKLFLSQC